MDDLKPPALSLAPSPEEIFRDHAPRVYNLARRMLGNDADAEDVTQDVLVQVLRKLDTFRGQSAFPTWLHRVTVNAALAHRRKRAVREEHRVHDPLESFLEDGHHNAPIRSWSMPPDQDVLDRETQTLIEEAIARLPEGYRDVFVLADVEGLANAEIGEMLGLSLAAVKSRLHRARLFMREALAPHFEGGGRLMTCKDLCELLLDFVSGELPEERELVQQHLKRCPPCVVYFETYEITIKLTRKLPCQPPPPQLMDRLRAAMEEIEKEGQ